MFYLQGFPDKCQAENSDQHRLVVEGTALEPELSANDSETNHMKNLQPDEKVSSARH